MTVIIGLHGAKGAGKDEFYRVAKRLFPLHDIRKVAYADPIKNEICNIFGLSGEEQYDQFKRTQLIYTLPDRQSRTNEASQISGRHVVREIGMMMRRYDENQFTRYVETMISTHPSTIWCITDLRFANELESIDRLGGRVVKILRKGVQYDGHVTETELPDDVCDYIIHNETNKLDLYHQEVKRVMESILTS